MAHSILIKNGTILTLGKANRVLQDHALLVEDGRIARIAPQSSFTGSYEKVLDAKGQVVMPGLINAHMHFYSTLVRGLGKAAPSKDFAEVLKNLWWRLDRQLSLEDTYMSAKVMLVSAIRKGTTTLIDHHASPGAVKGSLAEIAKAVKETGLRASLCYEVSDRDGEAIAQEGLEENADFIRSCQKEGGDQLKALFGLHAAFTLSDATLDKAARMGRELGAGFHIHVAEAQSDVDFNVKQHGQRVVERLERHGILGPASIAAHCVHVNEAEMDILARTQTPVAHNPQSNLNNAVGIANVVELAKRGVLVGLGTDAMTVNMLEEVRVAMWAQHLRQDNPTCAFMETAGALFFNNAEIAERHWKGLGLGQLSEGGAADIILMDYQAPTPLNDQTVLGHLVFGLSQATVDTTICGGRVLMEGKQLNIGLDEEGMNARSRELATALWDRF